MNKLPTLSDTDIFPTKEMSIPAEWKERNTVKIILLNSKNEIALITNPVHGFYLLPGGGIEDGEDVFNAADRECKEEVKYSILSPKIITSIEERRSRDSLKYETICVVANTGPAINDDLRTEDEKKNGLAVRWFPLKEGLSILKKQVIQHKQKEVSFYNTAFNIIRDYMFLERYCTLPAIS